MRNYIYVRFKPKRLLTFMKGTKQRRYTASPVCDSMHRTVCTSCHHVNITWSYHHAIIPNSKLTAINFTLSVSSKQSYIVVFHLAMQSKRVGA